MLHYVTRIQSGCGIIRTRKIQIRTLFTQCYWCSIQCYWLSHNFRRTFINVSSTAILEIFDHYRLHYVVSLAAKFPHHEVRWNDGILRSAGVMYIMESEMKLYVTSWKKNSCIHTKDTKLPVFIVNLVNSSAQKQWSRGIL